MERQAIYTKGHQQTGANSWVNAYYAYNGEMNNVEIANEEDFVWAYTFTIIDENKQWVDYSVRKEGALGEEPEFGWGYVRQLKIGKCEYNHIRNVYTAITIDDEHYRTLMLNNIVLISTIDESVGLPGEMQLNEFGSGNYNMTLKDNPEQNHFGSKCYNNIVGSYSNTFGNYCDSNTFGNYLRQLTVFDGVYYVSVTGGESDSSCVQTAQILNGTRGKSDTDKLQITFQTGVEFTQIAALKSTGELRIWNPADGV